MAALGIWNYWVVIVLMMIGLYIVIARPHLVKKLMGLAIFQVSVIMFYVSMAKVEGGTAPIVPEGGGPVAGAEDPLPLVTDRCQPEACFRLLVSKCFGNNDRRGGAGQAATTANLSPKQPLQRM